MYCGFCGTKLNNKGLCPKCNPSFIKKYIKEIIVIAMLLFIIFLLVLNIFSFNSNQTRTIMMYLDGNNLESESGIVSHELETIDPSKIDLSNTNVILYTGSTKKWNNYIKNDSNNYYKLEKDGFKLIKSEEQKSFGEASTFSNFINYVTTNYEADKYDLLIYDHGGAIDGAAYDEFTGDGLSLAEMSEALSNTEFNSKNKMDAVIFRTCLNGGLEIANTYKDYSNYLVASEQVSYGSSMAEVLNFVNDVVLSDNGALVGKKFLTKYEEQMSVLDSFGTTDYTYSVVDLNKIDNVNEEVNKFFEGIDLTKNYASIAQIRSNLYQYGTDTSYFDTVDLYSLVDSLKDYSSYDSKKVLNSINSAIVSNVTNIESSKGISIYFPFKGTNGFKTKFLSIYKNVKNLDNYCSFITKFNNLQKNPSSTYSFSISENKEDISDSEDSIKLDLTDEESKSYAYARMAIFKQMDGHPDYYTLLHITDDITLKNKQLVANYKNRLIKIESDGEYQYIYSDYLNSEQGTLSTSGFLYDSTKDYTDDDYMNHVTLYFDKDKSNNPVISKAKKISDNDYVNGTFADLSNYDKLEITNHSYRILDDIGNVLPSEDWESTPTIYGFEDTLDNVKFKYSSLDKDSKYYAVFVVHDVYDNISYSKLIEVN